eukprot:scaffold4978_cov117-Isochrysis_galbana.AAC.2
MAGVRLRFCLSVLDGSYLPGGESQNARSEWASERRAKSGIAERRARARLGHIYERSKSGASLPMAASLPSLGRVGSSKDGGACVESGLDARFRDGNGLLLHRFVDGHLPVETGCLRPGMLRTRPRGGMLKTWPRGGNAAVARAARCAWGWASHPAIPCPPRLPPHAPGRAAYAIVGEHQRPRLNAELASLIVLAHLQSGGGQEGKEWGAALARARAAGPTGLSQLGGNRQGSATQYRRVGAKDAEVQGWPCTLLTAQGC